MSMSINTNVASLNAQRNLSGSQSALSTSLQRLSSGARINSAKDDAAGLAISERMSSQINGLDQARRNANDGISLAQTAEGGITSASDMLQRMRTLAVQSANDTNSASDRKAIQSEVNQLKEELNRLVDTTQFNGKNILDGTLSNAQFQVGANANQTINVSIGSVRGTAIGSYQVAMGGTATGKAIQGTAAGTVPANGVTGDTLSISGNGATKAVAVTAGDSAKTIAANINKETGSTGVTATAESKATLSAIKDGTVTFKLAGDNSTAVAISASVAGSDYKALAEAINSQTSTTGISATLDKSGNVELTNKTGADIKIAGFDTTNATKTMTVTGADTAATAVTVTGGAATDSATIAGTIKLDSNSGFNVTGDASKGVVSAASLNGGLQSVDKIDISTTTGANDALKVIDAALSTVNARRADLGAVQNRFSNTISNLQSSAENLNASRGRILDTDFAAETARMSRNQVLQQAGTAMLAQANQLPQQVLQLLR
ncbi:flagellin N-terminal helical domain-containing protein [Craterilacuibacter sinensis]|uniref:Flagellin n=1 Tax=Craterilacuibacter sinensis TaxID=2686017 RepID=A0A845BS58_9NEIS|nr:flagellin [Craterilacuibacter sinensis]MXR35423.1 flagellin [Craterilacuibacter sinensis]